MDAQPAATDKASMIVLVTGQLIVRSLFFLFSLPTSPFSPPFRCLPWLTTALQTGDETNALNFSQAFHLMPENGSYYVYVSRRLVQPANAHETPPAQIQRPVPS